MSFKHSSTVTELVTGFQVVSKLIEKGERP
jgi:hypothetical protein